jgi:hypothetical protein
MAIDIAESTKRYNNPVATGVAMDIIEANPFVGQVPFQGIAGNSYKHVYEKTLGGVSYNAINAAIPAGAKTDATVDNVYFDITKVIGEATLDNLVAVTAQSAGRDQMLFQIQSKAKNIARRHALAMAKAIPAADADVANAINSLAALCTENIEAGNGDTAGADLSFSLLRELLDAVRAKDGQVDFLVMSRDAVRKLQALYDALGGTTPMAVVPNPFTGAERQVIAFEGIPVFKNDFLTLTETHNGLSVQDSTYAASSKGKTRQSIYAGTYDDGSKSTGLSFIYPDASPAGIVVEDVGVSESQDAKIVRVKQYVQLANFNRKGLARLQNIKV